MAPLAYIGEGGTVFIPYREEGGNLLLAFAADRMTFTRTVPLGELQERGFRPLEVNGETHAERDALAATLAAAVGRWPEHADELRAIYREQTA